MSDKTTIRYQNRTVEAERLKIVDSKETTSVYTLSDGTTVTLRTVAIEAFRLRDEWTDQGDPVYVMRSSTLMAANVPPELKQGGD